MGSKDNISHDAMKASRDKTHRSGMGSILLHTTVRSIHTPTDIPKVESQGTCSGVPEQRPPFQSLRRRLDVLDDLDTLACDALYTLGSNRAQRNKHIGSSAYAPQAGSNARTQYTLHYR
jgi:hypothetical protein